MGPCAPWIKASASASWGKFLSTFTDTGANMNMGANAQREKKLIAGMAPGVGA